MQYKNIKKNHHILLKDRNIYNGCYNSKKHIRTMTLVIKSLFMVCFIATPIMKIHNQNTKGQHYI